MPNLAWVEAEYSDVQNRLERHWYLEKSLVLFGAHMDQLLRRTTIVINDRGDRKNLSFLKRYYEEYFAPLVEIVVPTDNAAPKRDFVVLSDSDIYIEALDIRANLRMCEEFDAATGFDHVIALTHDQAALLRRTSITRGIDITNNPVSKNSSVHFFRRGAKGDRVFQSPNHALRLPRG
jgi:hypothetical protein